MHEWGEVSRGARDCKMFRQHVIHARTTTYESWASHVALALLHSRPLATRAHAPRSDSHFGETGVSERGHPMRKDARWSVAGIAVLLSWVISPPPLEAG